MHMGGFMKKFALLFAVALLAVSGLFAQDIPDENAPVDASVRTITPKDIHTNVKTANVKIEYTPALDEVRIYYTCMEVSFDQGDAMNSILACLKDFQAENQYYGYTHMAKDRTRYFTDNKKLKWVTYMTYVKFNR